MVNMLSFDLDDYKNEFVGRVADSYGEVYNDSQVWRQVFVRQKHEDTGWVDIVLDTPNCIVIQDGTCVWQNVMHQHQSLWPTKTKNSPIHRFLVALKDNTGVQINDPADLKGFVFRFYEWVQPGWTNKKTGQEYKPRPYFFVEGWGETAESAPEPAPIQAPMAAAAVPTMPAPTIAPAPAVTTNGANGATAPSASDYDSMLAMYCVGKTDQEIRTGLIVQKEVPELIAEPNARVNIMNASAMKGLEARLIIHKKEDGTYELMGV